MGKLNPIQEQKIEQLRSQGLGYKAIALQLDLPRDTVRNYCRTHDLENDAPSDTLPRVCLQCGKVIPIGVSAGRKKFCSDACRWKWWGAHAADKGRPMGNQQESTCPNCGKTFYAYRSKGRRYCSHACYIRDRFWRMEDGREPYISPSKT